MKRSFDEAEADALGEMLAGAEVVVSSILLRLEAVRAAERRSAEIAAIVSARLERVDLIPVSDAIWRRAESVPTPVLRSLDALHLATAESLGEALDALVTYDHRLTEGALLLGIRTLSPGA